MTNTMRLRTLLNPDGTWVYVVDKLTGGQAYQDEFARQLAGFTNYVRERTDKCVGVLVFHDTVELPGEPEPHWETQPVAFSEEVRPVDPVDEFGRRVNLRRRLPYCPVCDRHIQVYRTDLPEQEQTLYSHGDGEGGRCDGRKGPPDYRKASHG
jgi:hypothetical protein